MNDRYRTRRGQHDYRDRYGSRDRQAEQFSSDDEWQQGDDGWRGQRTGQRWPSDGEQDRGYGRNENSQRDDFTRSGSGYRGDTSSLDEYDRLGATRYGRQETTHNYFRGDDFGGQDYTRGSGSYGARGYGSGGYGQQRYGSGGYGSVPPRQYDRDERGFFDRASDEVMSWFGDDDAARRRKLDAREDHRGKGPSGYSRSNERMLEDANERLMHDSYVDASNITVTCEDGEITLTGTVESRQAKRRAEDIVDDISGVKHVQNNLRVETKDNYYNQSGTSTLSES